MDINSIIKNPSRTHYQQTSPNGDSKLKGLQENPSYGSDSAFAWGLNKTSMDALQEDFMSKVCKNLKDNDEE